MKFYNREKEIKLLANIQEAAEENAQMVTMMGAQTNWENKTSISCHSRYSYPIFLRCP